jgi:hypothetical protein
VRFSFNLEFSIGGKRSGAKSVGLFENLDEAFREKRRADAASAEDRRVIAAKFPKLWQALRQRVEDAAAEYNRRYPSSGTAAFTSTGDQMFSVKREHHPPFILIVSYTTPQVINIQRKSKGQHHPEEDYVDVRLDPDGDLSMWYNGERQEEEEVLNLFLYPHLKP